MEAPAVLECTEFPRTVGDPEGVVLPPRTNEATGESTGVLLCVEVHQAVAACERVRSPPVRVGVETGPPGADGEVNDARRETSFSRGDLGYSSSENAEAMSPLTLGDNSLDGLFFPIPCCD